MTKKELIEKGYIDQYVLGLTTDEESAEVERMANLYPEIQQEINSARHRICSNFNRNLTQPALRSSLLTKRRVLLWSALVVSFFSIGFCLLCSEHLSLQEDYTQQCEELAREQQKVIQLASLSRQVTEESDFLHAPETQRIRLKGSDEFPDAEAMIFQSARSGKMMLRVIDLPPIPSGHYYEIWASYADRDNFRIGQFHPPLRFDHLYSLEPALDCASLQIVTINPMTLDATPVCMTTTH